jgi:hypothetical protein
LPLFISLSLYLKAVSEYKGAVEPIFQHIVEEQCLNVGINVQPSVRY